MNFRAITLDDVERLFEVRASVRENVLTRDELAALSVTPQSTRSAMDAGELCGYLCEISGQVVGFAMANVCTQEIAVVAVRADFEGRGIGAKLLGLAEKILWETGCASIWLWTPSDPNSRAMDLYRKNGWELRETKHSRFYLSKSRPGEAIGAT